MTPAPVTLAALTRRTAQLMRRFGPLIAAELLALSIAMDLLAGLINPQEVIAFATGTGPVSIWGIYANPVVLTHEAIYAVLFAGACLRMAAPAQTPAPRLNPAHLAPLVGLSILSSIAVHSSLLLLILPGIVLSAALSLLVPLIALDNAGWRGLIDSWRATQRALGTLSMAWAVILLPWLVIVLSTAPLPADLRALPPAQALGQIFWAGLWLTTLSAGIGALTICLSMASWQLLQAPPRDSIARIFD